VYVHILDWQDGGILLPQLKEKIRSAKFLKGGTAAEFQQNDYGTLLKIPQAAVDQYDTVIVLEMAG
jgi:hypothetical protein